MPPCRAMAIAIRDSVTVSIARGQQRARAGEMLAGQPGRGVRLARDDVGVPGQQQDVVVGEAQGGEGGGHRGLVVTEAHGRILGERAGRSVRHGVAPDPPPTHPPDGRSSGFPAKS